MFRVSLLFVACLSALGPNAALLCEAWCAPPAAAACHAGQSSSDSLSLVRSHHPCNVGALAAGAILKDDTRRSGSGTNTAMAIPVALDPLVRVNADTCPYHQPPYAPSLEEQTRKTSLRI